MEWLKKNKLVAFLIFLLAFFLLKDLIASRVSRFSSQVDVYEAPAMVGSMEKTISSAGLSSNYVQPEVAPVVQEDRLVVEESSLSLLVKDVSQESEEIVNIAEKAGGFMVSTSLTHPEEAPFATVVVRVPTEKLKETLNAFREMAVKATSEKILGTDVTDQYVDLKTRMGTLEKTKNKFESIMDQASEIDDILRVQREIINLQEQIDRLKGRAEYLEKTAQLAKITVYLSTDELALPYAPAKPFRVSLIFKQAVRSLVLTLREFLSALVWLGVYAVIWLPALIIFLLLKRWWTSKKGSQKQSL